MRRRARRPEVSTGRGRSSAPAVHGPEPDVLSVRGGELWIEKVRAQDLVGDFGSPLFVLSEEQLRTNLRRFQRAFRDGWPNGDVDVLPAFKANTTLASRTILSSMGAGADVYSDQELAGVLRTGADPARVSVNGGGKTREHLARCIAERVRITVEDLDEVDRIQEVAAHLDRIAAIRLRVKPPVENLWRRSDFTQLTAPIDLAMQVYKSGIPAEYLPDLGRRALAHPNVELVGLHFHAGRHHASTWYWRGLMRRFAQLVGDLSAAWDGWQPRELDIGGGMASPRDPLNDETPRSEFVTTAAGYPILVALRTAGRGIYDSVTSALIPALTVHRAPPDPPTVEEYARVITSTLRRELPRHGISDRGVRLQVEPGRALYGNAGIHLARVLAVNEQTRPFPFRWVLTDTTCFFLTAGMLEHNRHPVLVAGRADHPASLRADVVGRSCFADRLVEGAELPAVETGDVLAFLETGAHLEASAANFNALPRPATVLVAGASAAVIRRPETDDDVYARDIVPERLLAADEDRSEAVRS